MLANLTVSLDLTPENTLFFHTKRVNYRPTLINTVAAIIPFVVSLLKYI